MNNLQNKCPSKPSDMSLIQAQKQQRLRINKVAIVQMLRVEHVLPALIKHGVFDLEDKLHIMSKKTGHEKARAFIDLLPRRGKEVDWYGCFCQSLKDPETRNKEVKAKYAILIEFLNNSILPANPRIERHSNEKMRIPHYDTLPHIESESPEKNRSGSKVKFDLAETAGTESSTFGDDAKSINETPSFETTAGNKMSYPVIFNFGIELVAPENFASIIHEPKEHFNALLVSVDPDDILLLEMEKVALERVKQLEILFALHSRGQLSDDFVLCLCNVVENVFGDSTQHHLYFKYFRNLKENFNLDIPSKVAASFYNMASESVDIDNDDTRQAVFKIAFGMFEFFHNYGMSQRAENVIYALIHILSQHPGIETWMATWEAFVKLMEIRNTNVSFVEADWVYNAILSVSHRIKMMSFGQDLLDESAMFCELSNMMKEQGSINPAYSWSLEALKEVEATNDRGIVEALICASQSSSLSYRVKKAEHLAIEAVKQARKLFGNKSPIYVKSLLNFCNYSSEFRQDDMGVEVGRKALDLAKQLFGVSDILVAQAHQTLATALIAKEQTTTEEYHEHAHTAWRMSLDVLDGDHPRLALFRYTLARSLLWRAMHGNKETVLGNLVWAETEAKAALNLFTQHWGEYSLKTAQTYTLLSQIYAKMDRYEEAESMLLASMSVHRFSVASQSKHMYLMKASLGMFYKTMDRPQEAITLLQDVVDNIDCEGVYLKRVNLAFDGLISLFQAQNHTKDAETYQAAMTDWMSHNPKCDECVSWEALHAEPLPYARWLEEFEGGSTRARKAFKRGFKNLKETLAEMAGKPQ